MDAPVQFLLENLSNLVKYHVDLISNAKEELENLSDDLRTLKATLKSAPGKFKKDELFVEWERQVRATVYYIEDIIDTCITEKANEKAKNFVKRTISKVSRASLAEQVKAARKKVETLFKKYNLQFANSLTHSTTDDRSAVETREIRQKRRQNKIIGFDEEARTVIGYLKEPSHKLEVISIIGMPGLGKTTLAWKIFQDSDIQFEFPTRIWVNISDDLNQKKVLRTVLTNFISQVQADDTPDEKLVDAVRNHLQTSGKFLLVMDDVWSKEAWDDLKSFLPMNNSGRVLITSREDKVASHANAKRMPHKLRFLKPEESWDLLQYEVYEGDPVPGDLIQVGKVISKSCDGLPLSIVVIGGVLKDKISEARGVSSIKKQWEEVSTSIQTYLVYGDKSKRLEKIIRLSYEKLPYDLRDCFLYLGVFPEDADIPAKKLTLLWIAEGFVQVIPGKILEETANDILKDLINRNLLMVEKEKTNGEAKICRVHDTIREFCRTEARYDHLNLFQEISWTKHGVFEPSVEDVGGFRRLCIYSNIHKFFLEKPKLYNARTFLCFPKSPINLENREMAPVIEAFDLLRVLDAGNIKFPKFPQKIVCLIHLRYLTLTFSNDQMKSLPEVMSKLWNLQTLIVDVPARTLEIKADIWMMRHLRHLKTKSSIVLKNNTKGKGGGNLQTLERLSPESCTKEVFNKANNLVKLGIQGDLSTPLYSECLSNLDRLNKLQLVHKVHNGDASRNPMKCLPEPSKFPPRLKILVLTSTYLEWERMSVLMRLDFLEVLKLKENAFNGNSWEAGTGGFKNLDLLDIERSEITFWKASEESFPKLRVLLLKNCEKLEKVPFELRKNLEMLSLERVLPSAVSSAQEIEKTKSEGNFVLKIAPADKISKP